MTTDERYVPGDDQVRGRYCDGTYRQTGRTTEGDDFDAWLARVRRDAAREALDGLMHRFELEQGRAASLGRGLDAQRAKLSRLTAETYRDSHYPETEG